MQRIWTNARYQEKLSMLNSAAPCWTSCLISLIRLPAFFRGSSSSTIADSFEATSPLAAGEGEGTRVAGSLSTKTSMSMNIDSCRPCEDSINDGLRGRGRAFPLIEGRAGDFVEVADDSGIGEETLVLAFGAGKKGRSNDQDRSRSRARG